MPICKVQNCTQDCQMLISTQLLMSYPVDNPLTNSLFQQT